MFNLQGSEIIFILLLALVVLGPEKLPSAIRKFTQTYAEIRKMGTGFQTELKSVLDEPMREMKETAGLLRDAADPMKIVADAEAGSDADQREAERQLRAQEIHDQRSARAADDATAAEADRPAVESDVEADEWADPVDLEATSVEPEPEPEAEQVSASEETEPEPAEVAASEETEPEAEQVAASEETDSADGDDSGGVEQQADNQPTPPASTESDEASASDEPEILSGDHADNEASA